MRRRARAAAVAASVLFMVVFIAAAGGCVTSKAYRIPSSAMEPTLHCGRPATGCLADASDRVLVSRVVYSWREPRRGDIVVFRTPPKAVMECGAGGTFVKRIVALPGETWAERRGRVYVDGEELDEPYVESQRRGFGRHAPRRVPPGHYFMMGDNRSQSCDSRFWGSVARGAIIGPVVARYWPPSRVGRP